MSKKKATISEKHIEAISAKTVTAVVSLFGHCHLNIQGKITGRLRNRFKTFVFTPTFPFCYFTFSVGDVEKIDYTETGVIVTLNRVAADDSAPKRRRRKKKKAPPVVAAETEIDLNATQAALSANT